MVALHYAAFSLADKQKTMVVAQNQREAQFLNREIRQQLKNEGILGHQEKTLQTFQPVFLSPTERKYALHYEKGMVLRYYEGRELKEFRVQGVIKEENALHVMNSLGKNARIACQNVGGDWAVFQEKSIAVSEKESLMVTGNMKRLNLMKGERVTVQSISSQGVILDKAGKLIRLNATELDKIHLDYHYTESMTQLRVEKSERVLTSVKSRAISQETLQDLSQKAEKEIIFYTDDPTKVAKQFQSIPKKTTIIDEVLKASHTLKKELTPQAIQDIKTTLSNALSDLNKEVIKTPIEKAVDYAIAKLSERNAGFDHADLVKTAISHSLGEVTLDRVEKVLRERIENGVLKHGRDVLGQTIWTTQEAIDLERNILKSIREGKGTQEPLMDKATLQSLLEKSNLNAGQKEACYLIGTTRDRMVMIQGYAGTGKSTMLAMLTESVQLLKDQSNKPIEILGCAPTHQAVKELDRNTQALGVKAQTLKSLLVEHEREAKDFSRTLVLLDESSMVSNRDFHDFQIMLEQSHGRVAYVGDKAQLLSVESGKPMELSLKQGDIAVAYMTELVRQTDPQVKGVVQKIIDGQVTAAFKTIETLNPSHVPREMNERNKAWIEHVEKMQSCVIEIPDPEPKMKKDGTLRAVEKSPVKLDGEESPLYLQQAVAKEYLSRTKDVRDNTITIVHSHHDRSIVHAELFDGLRALGEIGQEKIRVDRLVSLGLTRVEARYNPSYQIGDYVCPSDESGVTR